MENENSIGVRYYNDSLHNYMIIPCGSGGVEDYRYRMMAANRIPGLLSCSMRYIEGQCFLYYDITSRQTARSLFAVSKVTGVQLKQLIGGLLRTYRNLSEFLLSEKGLLLSPDYVYFDFEGESWYFTFTLNTPGQGAMQELGLSALAEFLAFNVDETDKWATACCFRLATLADNPNYILQESILEDENKQETETSASKEDCFAENEITDQDRAGEYAYESEFTRKENSETESENGKTNEKSSPKDDGKNKLWKGIFLAAVFSAMSIVILWIRNSFVLSSEEAIASRIGITGFICLAALSAARSVFLMFYEGGGTREEYLYTNNESDTAPLSVADTNAAERYEVNGPDEDYSFNQSRNEKPIKKLYGSIDGRKYRIDLDRLPCTVGQMDGFVDQVIKEPGVSRMHMRLDRDSEGRILVLDLNSTEGTFINGERLNPNDTGVLEEGDTLRMGNSLGFCYR